MLGGKNKHLPRGYTIVEVLIVLAVSGVMFVIAANFINGKQQKTAFSQAVNEMASRVQDTIEQVTDGQYSDIPFGCALGTPLQISASQTQSQGTNPSCVFIGKLFQFKNGGDPSSYEVFSLAAARSSTSLGPDVTPVRSADGAVDLTTQQTIPQHLQVTGSRVTINSSIHTYGFGFTQSQGTAGPQAGTYGNGAQTVNLIYAPSLVSATNEGGAITAITGNVALAKNASFCLTDGTYYAQINIGGSDANSNQLGVHVKMKGKDSTGC
jgi:prepilin-type N-terminal cleavage/methylation domain-containing protein